MPVVQTTPLSNDSMPWVIRLEPLDNIANVGWGTFQTDVTIGFGRYYSDNAQNDTLSWDVALAAGTWTFRMYHYTSSDVGIYTIKFGATTVGTIDGYTAGGVADTKSDVTGIVVGAAGKVRVSLNMLTKHASSSGYRGMPQIVTLLRTA